MSPAPVMWPHPPVGGHFLGVSLIIPPHPSVRSPVGLIAALPPGLRISEGFLDSEGLYGGREIGM